MTYGDSYTKRLQDSTKEVIEDIRERIENIWLRSQMKEYDKKDLENELRELLEDIG